MTLLYFALDNYFFILQVFFNFDLLCRSVICIFVCNLITYWQSFWKKRNIFMVSIDCVCFICPYIWSQTFEIGICFNIYIYIYIYYIYIYIFTMSYGTDKIKLNCYMLLWISCVSNRQAYIMFILPKRIKVVLNNKITTLKLFLNSPW